jgi:type I restriction enzyme S subunit
LGLDILKNLPIPIFSPKIQQLIEKIVIAAHTKRNLSKSLYTEAEQLLLQELGLVNFKPSTENIAIKKLSESFGTTGRLDAEYYQPKYEEIENVISKYRLGYNAIGSVFKLSKQNFKVDKDKLYEYVEIGSINVSSGEIVPELITGAELPSNAKRKLKVGQVIVSKVRTYRSGIAIIDKDNYVGSTAFSILEEKPNGKVNKETLFSFLRSNLFLEWSLKPNTGTSYPVILDEDILNFNIPLIDTNIQNIIASKIQQSFALRKESKHLLDIAKQAVEMAIEEDEETAIKWLNEVTIPETNIHEKS